MKTILINIWLLLSCATLGYSQQVSLEKYAPCLFGDTMESSTLLSMNDMGMEFGYMLYEADVVTETPDPVLEVENIRDYAAVYWDGRFAGELDDSHKSLPLKAVEGAHKLQIYVENKGRITYGPEILDNSKGLFGRAMLDGIDIEAWRITPINLWDGASGALKFRDVSDCSQLPGYWMGNFDKAALDGANYVDMTGWGMGEVWINGQYAGSYWEKSGLRTVEIPQHVLKDGKIVAEENVVDPEYPITLECKVAKIQNDEFGFRVIGEIVNVVADEKVLDENGKVDPSKLNAFVFDQFQSGYYKIGEKVGTAWKSGMKYMK